MAKEDRSQSLRNKIEELREEAAALSERAKKTAGQAEILSERIKHLENRSRRNPSNVIQNSPLLNLRFVDGS